MPKHEPLVFDQMMTVNSGWARDLALYDRHIAADNSRDGTGISFSPGQVSRLRFLGGISVNFTEEFSSDAVPEIATEFRYVDLSLGEDQVRLTTYPQVAREFHRQFTKSYRNRMTTDVTNDHFGWVRPGLGYETVIFPSSALEIYVEPEAKPRRSIWGRLLRTESV